MNPADHCSMLSYVARQGWSHIFALGCIEELPTLHLALANLAPRLRNDHVFAGLFFVTRLVLHIALVVAVRRWSL